MGHASGVTASVNPPLLARRLHGRATEQIALKRVFEPDGPPAVAIVGEAGIGKTRLVRWLAETGAANGHIALEGRAQLGLTESFGILRDVVRDATRVGLEPPGNDVVAHHLPELLRRSRDSMVEGSADDGVIFESAVRFLDAVAAAAGFWSYSKTSTGLTRTASRSRRFSRVPCRETFD